MHSTRRLLALATTLVAISSIDAHAQHRRTSSGKQSSTLTLQQQAEEKARSFWNARIIQCGSDYYTRDRLYLHEFRNTRIDLKSNPLSPADRLNGIEYVAVTNFYAAQSRTYSPATTLYNDPGWGSWADGFTASLGGVGLYAEVRKEHGRWTVTPSQVSQAAAIEAVTCAEVANPLQSYRNWVQKRQQAAMSAEVRQFMSQAESYWHLYFNELPNDAYAFLAKNPNRLQRVLFFPNGGWAMVGSYDSTSSNIPDDIKRASQERDLSSVTVSANGGWVMLNRVIENFNGRERRGFTGSNLPQAMLTKLWDFYNAGRRIDIVRMTGNGAWVIIDSNQPNTGTPCYLTDNEHGFGYWHSDDVPAGFAAALKRLYEDRSVCRINDIAFTPNGGYVIVFNYRDYVGNNLPAKILDGLNYWKNAPFSSGATNVSVGFNGKWIVYDSN